MEMPLGSVRRFLPASYLLQKRPVGQSQVRVHFLPGISRKDEFHGVSEDIPQVNVDGSGRPVIVHVRIEIHPGVEEHLEGRQTRLVDREPFVRDDTVVDQARQVDRTDCDPAHVGIPQDIVEIVRRVASRNNRLKVIDPARDARVVLALLLEDDMCDHARIQFFSCLEKTGWAAPNLPDGRTEKIPDDDLSQPFVRQAEPVQEVVVEEMAKRSVPDIVDQGGDSQELLDEVG